MVPPPIVLTPAAAEKAHLAESLNDIITSFRSKPLVIQVAFGKIAGAGRDR
jgi:hypothetical protein